MMSLEDRLYEQLSEAEALLKRVQRPLQTLQNTGRIPEDMKCNCYEHKMLKCLTAIDNYFYFKPDE